MNIANFYDFLLSPFLRSMRSAVTNAAVDMNPERSVDLCCGTGQQLKILKKKGLENLTGVDLSENMLAVAGKGPYAPACLREDASATSLDSESVDLVLINLALHEKSREDAEAVLGEAARILKPGASLIVGDYNTESSVPAFPAGVITFIEFIAGGEHFANYKKYMAYGGLPVLLENKGFSFKRRQFIAFGGITVEVWIKA